MARQDDVGSGANDPLGVGAVLALILALSVSLGACNRRPSVSSKPLATLSGNKGSVKSIAFSPDGRFVVTGSLKSDGRLWSVPKGKLLATLGTASNSMAGVQFSPDGKRVATGGVEDGTIRLWSVPAGELVAKLPGKDSIVKIRFSPNGELLTTTAWRGPVRLWSVSEGRLIRTLELVSKGSVVFSPDGKQLLVGPRIWSVPDGKLVTTLAGANFGPARFSADGKLVVGILRVWSLPSGRVITKIKGEKNSIGYLALSADGHTSATWTSERDEIRLRSIPDGILRATLDARIGGLASMALSPDGRLLASGGNQDGDTHLWSVPDGKRLAAYKGGWLEKSVGKLVFSRDGKLLAAGGWDRARLWSVAKPN